MSLSRIWGIIIQEVYVTKRSVEVIVDLFFFSMMTTIAYGLVTIFLTGEIKSQASGYLFSGMILNEIVRITQYSMSVGVLWNIWSRNLSNLFVTPLLIREFLIAHMISGIIKALPTFILIAIISKHLFQFDFFSMGVPNLTLFFINLTVFAWALGILINGFIFRYGTRIQALAWGLIFLIQPLTAAFFPVDILPIYIRVFSYLLPPTYVFEAGRMAINNPEINLNYALIALLLNIFWLTTSIIFFNLMFKRSKTTGQFARMEG